MSWFSEMTRTAIAKKAIMALTGLMLFGFVLSHMAGNLKAFQGAEKFNAYAEGLRELGTPFLPHAGLLWIMRLGLLGAVGLHIWSATSLTLMNRRARPEAYRIRANVQADYAARTMRYSGYLLGFYILYHLMHLTFGNVHHDFIAGDAYHNLVKGFQVMPIAVMYIFANLLLGLHLYHGLWSLFQSLGLNHPRYNAWRRQFAMVFALIVTAGFVSVPIGVLAGWVA